MSDRFSKSEIDRLGDRIRQSGPLEDEDLRHLQAWREHREPHLLAVRRALVELGFTPTARLKTTNTLLEKLRRQPGLRLSKVQDFAGCRIVVQGGRARQNTAVEAILGRFPGARVVDRRKLPSHGYRAVHVIVTVEGWPVEVQVRTDLQHAWAQVNEQFADLYGRELRYGGRPSIRWRGAPGHPAHMLLPLLRVVATLLQRRMSRLSEVIDAIEQREDGTADAEQVRRTLLALLTGVLWMQRFVERRR